MAKINATYSSGYYLAHDTDYRKLEEEEAKLRVAKRKREHDGVIAKDDIKRQTFAMPFNVVCLHCNRRNSRGTHGYVNRRGTSERFMGMRIWELECRCIFCKGLFYLKTDYETPKITGGYVCDRFCKRGEGDYYSVNKVNEMLRKQREAEEAQRKDKTLEALERESEVMRQVNERQRHAFEVVEERADRDDATESELLLSMIRRDAATKKKEQPTGGMSSVSKRIGYSDDLLEDSVDREGEGGKGEDDDRDHNRNHDDDHEDEDDQYYYNDDDEKDYAEFQKRLEMMALEETENGNDGEGKIAGGGGEDMMPDGNQDAPDADDMDEEDDGEEEGKDKRQSEDASSVEHMLAQMNQESRRNRFAEAAEDDVEKHTESAAVQHSTTGRGLLASMFDDDDDDDDDNDDDK